MKCIIIYLTLLLQLCVAEVITFPQNFIFGVSSSAYQSEGAWNEDGKGENIWDRFTHTHPERIKDQANGDISSDSYHNYKEDVQLLQYLGVDFYRFSISWSRILPTGMTNKINKMGINYYNNLINELISHNIQPIVTLYHWDLPQLLQDLGGWTNPILANYFEQYANIVFENFGDRIKQWITFNEPKVMCVYGYGDIKMAPGINASGIGEYLCGHTVLMAHANVYHLYNIKYKKKQNGQIGIALHSEWFEPNSDSEEDLVASDRKMFFDFGWFCNPIFHENGDYPKIMKARISLRSKLEKYTLSRLPALNQHEINYVKGTYDFLGVNIYTASMVAHQNIESDTNISSYYNDIGVKVWKNSKWPTTPAKRLMVVPYSIRKLLNWIKKYYGDLPILITENGYADDGRINDYNRISFIKDYLRELLKAIYEDNIKVVGYAVWTLVDNFEWFGGYECFGLDNTTFPKYFLFGVASSAYQTEGAWNEEGKGENIWDRFSHTYPDRIKKYANGDIAANSYYKYKDDVQLLKFLGANFYKFSLSWSRILPTGMTNIINKNGINYYNNLINELLFNGIRPVVTLYQWDLPQPLQELGGWANPILAKYYQEYADVVFENFGNRVKTWITFDEPRELCVYGYGDDEIAPGVNASGVGEYLCGYTILKAHANAYHLYNNKYKKMQHGKIGIALHTEWFEPNSNSTDDKDASNRKLSFDFGWFCNPIYHKNGNYPQIMKDQILARSRKEGFKNSRLPDLKYYEINYIRGTYDFLGVNFYTASMVSNYNHKLGVPSFYKDTSVKVWKNPNWKFTHNKQFAIVPESIRKLLNWIKNNYKDVPIIITENGFADNGLVDDYNRIEFIEDYLHQVLEAIYTDNIQVVGYTVWSLVDTFEWDAGYDEKYGLFSVDFSSPDRTRYIKQSAYYYKNLIKTRKLLDV